MPSTSEWSTADTGDSSTGSNPRLGHGLIGMQERAALYGGQIEAGPLAEGGFGVLATLPTGVT